MSNTQLINQGQDISTQGSLSTAYKWLVSSWLRWARKYRHAWMCQFRMLSNVSVMDAPSGTGQVSCKCMHWHNPPPSHSLATFIFICASRCKQFVESRDLVSVEAGLRWEQSLRTPSPIPSGTSTDSLVSIYCQRVKGVQSIHLNLYHTCGCLVS